MLVPFAESNKKPYLFFSANTGKRQAERKLPFICYGLGLLAKTRSIQQFFDVWLIIEENWKNELQIPDDFLKYIHDQYIKSKFTWNQSTFQGKSRTNNSIESFNNQLKQVYFEHKRFDIISFFTVAKQMVKDFSIDMVSFPTVLEIPLSEWRIGLSLSKNAISNFKKNSIVFVKHNRDSKKVEEREK